MYSRCHVCAGSEVVYYKNTAKIVPCPACKQKEYEKVRKESEGPFDKAPRAATIAGEKDLDAGAVSPGPQRYTVTYTHGHLGLEVGDTVVMSETPDLSNNMLIRTSDMTLHGLTGAGGQRVHLRPLGGE